MTVEPPANRIETGGGAVFYESVTAYRDVIGRDQFNIDNKVTQYFYAETGEVMPSEPFFPDRPFRDSERRLFAGRQEDVDRVLLQVDDPDRRAVVVYGPADVGKTSFLVAGLLPGLNRPGHRAPQAEWLPIRYFDHASRYLHALLLGYTRQKQPDLPDTTATVDLVKAYVDASARRFVLVLDQFERFFQPGVTPDERQAFTRDLAQIMERVPARYFQMVVAIQGELVARLDRQWAELAPGVEPARAHLEPLSPDQAKQAILRPQAVLGINPVFESAFVGDLLLPSLERLSPGQEGILPADLQIVCDGLFKAARALNEPVIDDRVYVRVTGGKGAEWIMGRHFDSLLERVEGPRRPLARDVTAAMLARGAQRWAAATDVLVSDAGPEEIGRALDDMAGAGLLIGDEAEGRRVYGFASQSIANAAERALGPAVQRRLQAQKEVENAWREWVNHDAWATRYQLNLVDRHYAAGPLPPEQALLLLRSAVERRLPTGPWIERARTPATRQRIEALETGQAALDGGDGKTPYNAVRLILCLPPANPAAPPNPAPPFGPVSRTAAVHDRAECRETAALALLVADGGKARPRVEAAVAGAGVRRPAGRLAELLGILADADPGLAAGLRDGPPARRLGVWGWRFRRRFVRDLPYVGRMVLGGALGAGLALGVLRAVLGAVTSFGVGYGFYNHFPTGFVLGAGVTMGLLLVNALRLAPPEHAPESTGRRPLLPSVALGALGFAAAHLFLILLLGPATLTRSPLLQPLSLLAGAAVSLAVADQPMAGQIAAPGTRLRRLAATAARWGWRLAVVAGAFALSQIILQSGRPSAASLQGAWPGDFYDTQIAPWLEQGLATLFGPDNWFRAAAVLDSALTGIALAAGLAAGLVAADRWYRRWRALVDRAGD